MSSILMRVSSFSFLKIKFVLSPGTQFFPILHFSPYSDLSLSTSSRFLRAPKKMPSSSSPKTRAAALSFHPHYPHLPPNPHRIPTYFSLCTPPSESSTNPEYSPATTKHHHRARLPNPPTPPIVSATVSSRFALPEPRISASPAISNSPSCRCQIRWVQTTSRKRTSGGGGRRGGTDSWSGRNSFFRSPWRSIKIMYVIEQRRTFGYFKEIF